MLNYAQTAFIFDICFLGLKKILLPQVGQVNLFSNALWDICLPHLKHL